MKPLVAIVGRPNVGKSTLFNRLAGKRLALVEDVPGVTRDRHYADAEWGGRVFTAVDTGGFVPGERDELLSAVRQQAQLAVEECDVVLMVVDGRTGPTAADRDVAQFLRKSGKPSLLVVNKLDNPEVDPLAAEFYKLGLGEPFPASAEHARGLTRILDEVVARLPPAEEEEPPPPDAIRVAIVGRPNVGKSTLVNALLHDNRLVASAVPGTTRDAIDSELEHGDQRFVLTDTAGIRRKRALRESLEEAAVLGSLKAIDRSEVVALVLDATEAAVDQDVKIASIAEEKGRALLVVVNKWDRIPEERRVQEGYRSELKYRLKFMAYAPIVFTSALEGRKVGKVLELAAQLHEEFHFRAPTPKLNRLLQHMTDTYPAPISRGRPLRLYYIAQVSTAPPTFLITCNHPEGVPDSYRRYLVNRLREALQIRVPIHLVFRERPGKAKRESRKHPS